MQFIITWLDAQCSVELKMMWRKKAKKSEKIRVEISLVFHFADVC